MSTTRSRKPPAGWLKGPGRWWLAPQGAVVHPRTQTAVVADVHLGYEWARGTKGDCVPAHSLDETIGRLDSLLEHIEIHRLVVAGDLVESRRYCRRTESDVARLTRWLLDRAIDLVALAGNHDPPRRPPRLTSLIVDGWTIAHGDKAIVGSRTITGHQLIPCSGRKGSPRLALWLVPAGSCCRRSRATRPGCGWRRSDR